MTVLGGVAVSYERGTPTLLRSGPGWVAFDPNQAVGPYGTGGARG